MTTLTVQLSESNLTQPELQSKLGAVVGELKREGLITKGSVEAVFPGHQDSRRRSTFVVELIGGAEEVASRLNDLPEVERAYIAPARRVLGR
jgi:hypothetical protein